MLPYSSWSSRPPGSAAAADPASSGALYRLPAASSCFTRLFAPAPSTTTTTTWTTTDGGTRVRSPTTTYTPAGTCTGAAAPNPAAGTRTPADTRSAAAAAAARTAVAKRCRDVAAAAAARMSWRRLSAPARNDHHEGWRLWMGGHDPATPMAEALINTHNHNVMWMTFIMMTVLWALKCRM